MIVYLDQNAISDLAINRNQCPQLERLKNTLLKGHQEGLILCPIPPETILETIGIESKVDRLTVYRLQSELASFEGQTFAFKAFHKVLNEDSLALVRGLPRTSRLEPCVWHSVEDEMLIQQNRRNIEQVKRMWSDGFAKVGAALANCALNTADASQGIRTEHGVHLLRQIERVEKGEHPDRGDDVHLAYDLITYLTSQNVSSEELSLLKEAVINRYWEAIPVVFYRACLAAELEVRYRAPKGAMRFHPNDQIDIARMTVAMDSASVVITERLMANCFNTVVQRINNQPRKIQGETWSNHKAFGIREADEASHFIEHTMRLHSI